MMDWTRFGHRPDCAKLFTLFITILIIMATSAAIYQPAGTGIIWTTTIIALIADLLSILVLGLSLDFVFVFRKHRILTWSLIEVLISILSAILYFVCIWLCIHGANYGSTTAFTVSGLLAVISIVGLSTAKQFLAVGICMFVSIFSLIVTSLNIGIIASDWHKDFTNIRFFQGIIPGQQIHWHHLQFTISIFLMTFNFLSFILLATMAQMVLFGGNYFLPSVSTLVITFLYCLEACIAFRMDPADDPTFGDDYEQIS